MVSMEAVSAVSRGTGKLEVHLGYWLRRVSNAVSGGFGRALQAEQTSVAEWVVMSVLSECEQATPSELAEIVGMTRGAVSKIIDKLEAKMWLRTRGAAGDNRVRLLSLSREGRRRLPVLAEIADEGDAHFFACLDASEKRTLRALLGKVAAAHNIHEVPTE